ncbi:MAG: helix-turn-helix domain-containing protein [Chloroflexota bacterium]
MFEQFPAKAFYSPAEVAHILDVSNSHITNMIKSGSIEAVRLSPRIIRISYGTLMRLVGQPLPVSRGTLTADEVEAGRRALRNEDVEVPDDRLVAR